MKTKWNKLLTPPENIFEAVVRNNETALRDFVENKNASVATANQVGQSLVHVAAFYGFSNILEYLLSKDNSLVTLRDRWNHTALHMAVEHGTLEIVRYLVDECNADVNSRVSDLYFGNTGLHIAAEEGHLEVFKYFLEQKKMDANLRNSEGRPAAFLAANFDHLAIIQYLVENTNADLTVTDNKNRTILHMLASYTNQSLRVPKYLLDEKKIAIDVNARDVEGLTALNLACNFPRNELIKYLVGEKGADVNLCDDVGRTPLHQASYMNNMEIVKYLVEHGGEPRLKDKENRTAIELTKRKEIAQFLEIAVWERTPEEPTTKTVHATDRLPIQETTESVQISPDSTYQDSRNYDRGHPREYDRGHPREYNRGHPREYDRGPYRDYDRNPPREYDRGSPREYDRDSPRQYDRGPPREYDRGGRGPPRNFPRDPPQRPDHRYRRSLSKPQMPISSFYEWIPTNFPQSSAVANLNEERPVQHRNIDHSPIGNILLLVNSVLRCSSLSSSLLSPEEMLKKRMDEIAIDAVNSITYE